MGIVEEMGAITGLERQRQGVRLRILASKVLEDLEIGASISVNGICLTAVDIGEREFAIDVSTETLAVTTLGTLTPGAPVNLERAMKLHHRIGGHLVSGHVDGVGRLRARQKEGNTVLIEIEAPREVLRLCVPKGSVTVDGISLTVNEMTERSFRVALIPHTEAATTLGLKQVGDPVNLESDLIGKYVERLLQQRSDTRPTGPPAIDKDYLQRRGLI